MFFERCIVSHWDLKRARDLEHERAAAAAAGASTRLLVDLDHAGRIARIQCEPQIHIGARRIAVAATHRLIDAAYKLIWAIEAQANVDGPADPAGPRDWVWAFSAIAASRELATLREAAADVRPYLAIANRTSGAGERIGAS